MRTIRWAALTWFVVAAFAWLFGPVGFVAGGCAFLAGWAVGHRMGYHHAEVDALTASRAPAYVPEDWTREGDR